MADPDLAANLPSIIYPLLDYLETLLESYPTVYTTIVTLLSHSYALLTSLLSLVSSLFTSSTSDSSAFSAEKILPPLITLFTAYLALVSFYRTTGWMIRTAVAFVKWSFVLTSLGALAGYFIANANVEGQGAAGLARAGLGLLPALGGFVGEMLTGQPQNTRAGSRTPSSSSTKSQSQSKSKAKTKPNSRQPRPKAYESWDRHREWQYSETQHQDGQHEGADVQKIIGDIIGGVKENAPVWWEAAKKVVGGLGKDAEDEEDGSTARSR